MLKEIRVLSSDTKIVLFSFIEYRSNSHLGKQSTCFVEISFNCFPWSQSWLKMSARILANIQELTKSLIFHFTNLSSEVTIISPLILQEVRKKCQTSGIADLQRIWMWFSIQRQDQVSESKVRLFTSLNFVKVSIHVISQDTTQINSIKALDHVSEEENNSLLFLQRPLLMFSKLKRQKL